MQWTLENFCKKRDHGMKDLQPVLVETLKQDPSRYQMWNIYKLNKLKNMYIKIGKKLYV